MLIFFSFSLIHDLRTFFFSLALKILPRSFLSGQERFLLKRVMYNTGFTTFCSSVYTDGYVRQKEKNRTRRPQEETLVGWFVRSFVAVWAFFFFAVLSSALFFILFFFHFSYRAFESMRLFALPIYCKYESKTPPPPPPNKKKQDKELGRGTYGRVIQATHRGTGRKFACKVVNVTRLEHRQVSKLYSEVSVLRELDHPHIVRMREIFYSKVR